MEGISPDTILQDCFDESGDHKTEGPINYRQFTDILENTRQIHLDEYDPPSPTSPSHPAVLLVHGGGWVGGCRSELDPLAVEVAGAGYIVFSIDYRLSCPDDMADDVYLCGFHFSVPPDDVRYAVKWVRDHASSYANFNGQVAAIGTSAGGNLVFDVGLHNSGDYQPDVMVGVSPPSELGYMSNEHAFCADSYESQLCADGAEAFMDFALTHPPGHPYHCEDNWVDASPACNVDPENPPPPAFIANATEEQSTLLGSQDLATELALNNFTYTLCTVGLDNSNHQYRHLHGTHLLNPDVNCDSPLSGSVFDNMMDFISENL